MSTVTALASPLAPLVIEGISSAAIGSASGGAIVPAGRCQCNCGMTASVDCGTITATYYGDDFATLAFRDYWEWIDTDGGIEGTIGDGFYVAALVYATADEGCEPALQVNADNLSGDGGFGQIIVTTGGAGSFYTYEIFSGEVQFTEAATRPGVIIGSAAGSYGTSGEGYFVTVPKSTPISWRVNG